MQTATDKLKELNGQIYLLENNLKRFMLDEQEINLIITTILVESLEEKK